MTIGHWQAEASAALQTADQAMRGQSATAAEAYAVIDARSRVYGQLARGVEQLAGGRPVAEVPSRETAALLMDRSGQSLTRLYVGLRLAMTDGRYPPLPADPGAVAVALRRAADAIGVAGDILATHLPSRGRRASPEGRAIRSGGGVAAALGDIARLTRLALEVDARLVDWLDDRSPAAAETYRPVLEAAWWTTQGRLADAAGDLVAGAAGQPRLLDELEMSRQPLDPVPTVETAAEAIAAVTAARDWLWQHRDQTVVEHLRLATRLGLEVHVALAVGAENTAPTPELTQWRAAAVAAAQLRGTPAAFTARDATAELAEALRWVHGNGPVGAVRDPSRVPELARLAERLPGLANTLYAGLRDAVQRGDVFVPGEAVLVRPRGALVYRAVQQWRPGVAADDEVRAVGQILMRLSGPVAGAAVAAAGFPAPTRTAQTSTRAVKPAGGVPAARRGTAGPVKDDGDRAR
ncbi:hypothetical protein [Actinoplanes subglobosus]|uniref:Uncharacterized protein n=1 Tax=Actinoplanes subglobosus TaxID=1547892 RepID=A0ABV8IUZ7_9ACTN